MSRYNTESLFLVWIFLLVITLSAIAQDETLLLRQPSVASLLRPATADTNLYSLFEKTANRQTVLKVNSKPTDEGARTVTVLPISSDRGLRHRAWIEGNRSKVDEMSDCRVAYVYVPQSSARK